MLLFDESRAQDLCARLLDKQNERGCSFDSKHGQRVRHSNDAEIKKPPDNNQAVFYRADPYFRAFFSFLILPSCLAIFSRRAAIFFLISFLLALAICVAPFAVVTPEVSVSLSIDVPECHKVAVWAKLFAKKSTNVGD